MQSRYIQIAEQIRGQIADGLYPEGSRIPTENELAQSQEVSRPTVRQALDLLVREGRLVRVKGSGTFVAQPKLVHESTSFVTGYREESRKKSRILRTKVVCLQTEKAGEQVGDALKISAGDMVTRLVRIRHLENLYSNAPVVYTTLYVPLKLFPEMPQLDFTDTSFYEALDSRGLSVVHASRKLEVVMPPAEVAAGLGITPFEPAAFITSRGYTQAGRTIEYTESYYPASRSSFQIEINR
jgi:GntR family transcriptional regulator